MPIGPMKKLLRHESERDDFSQNTWISLLGLLHPYEFFMTVDQTTLWRRHIAWAKPKGKDIRDYTTERFASNMVFLSLLLGAEMNVLFNSSVVTTKMRHNMQANEYGSLLFWIGIIVTIGACVTVLGLVTTFTAWGMISAISDTNAHALLRSSMGQYVTNLPSRFVVAALYLFLLWLMLFLVELMSGPVLLILISLVAFLFFQVITSLSAFGRLIIHTGAMGKKPVLDPEFEKFLLPSGLHASLLIKATDRCRRRTSVVSQYGRIDKRQPSAISNSTRGRIPPSVVQERHGSVLSAVSFDDYSGGSQRMTSRMSEEDLSAIHSSAKVFGDSQDLTNLDWEEMKDTSEGPAPRPRRHRRDPSTDSIESVDELTKRIPFPRPSVLNKAEANELKQVVEMTLSRAPQTPHLAYDSSKDLKVEEDTSRTYDSSKDLKVEEDTPRTVFRKMAKRQSALVYRRGSTKQMKAEWEAEEDVRNMYDVEPPIEPFDYEEDGDYNNDLERMPRASLLNQIAGLDSFRRLLGNEEDSEMRRGLLEKHSSNSHLNIIEEESTRSSQQGYDALSPSEFRRTTSSVSSTKASDCDSVDEEKGTIDGGERHSRLAKSARRVFGGRGKRSNENQRN